MINSAEKITPGTINILLEINQNLAPGSGTDGIILICDSTSVHVRTDAGKNSKHGEMIGNAVKRAVKEALYLQAGVCAPRQH